MKKFLVLGLMGLGLGLVAGVVSAIGLEFINDTIKSREDVRKKLEELINGHELHAS